MALWAEILSEILEYIISNLQERFQTLIDEHWYNLLPAFNPGQVSVYFQHIEEPIYWFQEEVNLAWPWVDVGWYVDSLYGCYDFDVMERAFSDAIDSPVEQLEEILYRAQALQETVYYLESIP